MRSPSFLFDIRGSLRLEWAYGARAIPIESCDRRAARRDVKAYASADPSARLCPSTVTYAADVMNQYTTLGGASRVHDNNGNLTDDATNTYVYDYKNRLVEVKLKSTGVSIATYKYDALGRRVEKALNAGATTRYVLCGQQVIEEYDATDTWQAAYIYEDGIDHPRAMDRADVTDVNGNSNTTEVLRFHYHQNALSSTSEMTQPTGAVVEWVTYDVYGKATIRDKGGTVVTQSAVGNPYLYTGREYDPESGMYFYRARTYDPVAGRFLQRDPLGYVDGLGLYEYVSSSPSSRVDPSGLDDTRPKKIRSSDELGTAPTGPASSPGDLPPVEKREDFLKEIPMPAPTGKEGSLYRKGWGPTPWTAPSWPPLTSPFSAPPLVPLPPPPAPSLGEPVGIPFRRLWAPPMPLAPPASVAGSPGDSPFAFPFPLAPHNPPPPEEKGPGFSRLLPKGLKVGKDPLGKRGPKYGGGLARGGTIFWLGGDPDFSSPLGWPFGGGVELPGFRLPFIGRCPLRVGFKYHPRKNGRVDFGVEFGKKK